MLCFWLAYILTRPLGANIGDYLASAARRRRPRAWAPSGTSVLFLGTILAVVVYLTVTDKDRTEAVAPGRTDRPVTPTRATRSHHDRTTRTRASSS